MKNFMKTALFISAVLVFTAGIASAQTRGPGMMGPGSGSGYGYAPPQGQGWFCPYCGAWHAEGRQGGGPGWGMGPGMMGPGYGYGRGGGMMGPGPGMMHRWGGGYGPMHRGWQGDRGYAPGRGRGYGYQGPEEPLDKDEARGIVERYLNSSRNPNLKVGKIVEKEDVFEAEIVTRKGGDLVDRVQIDRRTGWMRSVYE